MPTSTSTTPADAVAPGSSRPGLGDLTGVLLLRAAHPWQAGLTAAGLAAAAAVAGRSAGEVALVATTVLVGQAGLGWLDDLTDQPRDLRHQRAKPLVGAASQAVADTGSSATSEAVAGGDSGAPSTTTDPSADPSTDPVADPVAHGTSSEPAGAALEPGSLWFALAIAVLAVVPLALGNGVHAGIAYLLSLGVAAVGTLWPALHRGFFSWVAWAVSFGLFPAFLSYSGPGGGPGGDGSAPTVAMTALAALLGVGVHVLTSVRGLAADRADGWTHLPLRLGDRLGATRLLGATVAYLALVLGLLALAGATVGLSQPPLS